MSFLMRFEKSGPTQKVQVKQRNLRRKTGEVVVQPAHTETRKKAAPKPKADPKPSAEKALAKTRAGLKPASPVELPKPARVWISEEHLPRLQAKINDLNRKAKRIGTDPITLELGQTKKVELKTRYDEELWRNLVEVTVNGPEPRYADWQFVAALKPLTSGNMIFAIGDQEVPRKYRKADMTCDHCGTSRKRNATYVIRSTETGEYKQVGRSCLKDFMGHGNPAQFADLLAAVAEYVKEVDDWGDDDEAAYWDDDELPPGKYFSIERYLGYVVASIQRFGWTSRKDAEWEGQSSADEAADWMFPPRGQQPEPPPDAAWKKAKAALSWIRKKPEKWANTNYLMNLRLLCKEDVIGADEIGIAASLIPLYDREKESERRAKDIAAGKGSQHVGAIGERRDFKLKITSVKPYDGNYGIVYITKLLDDDGNEFTWFASNEPGEEGKTYNITATIKKHDEFRGVPQTHITRGKVKGLAKSFALALRKAVRTQGPTQKVTVKASTRRTKSGKTTTVKQHTATRKKAEPKEPSYDPVADYRENGIRARAFKAWFGDWENDPEHASKVVDRETGEPKETHSIPGTGSKVKDEDGKPIVVYHGTPRGGFEAFDKGKQNPYCLYGPGFYFTEDKSVADSYSKADESLLWKPGKYLLNPDGQRPQTLTGRQARNAEMAIRRIETIGRTWGKDGLWAAQLAQHLRDALADGTVVDYIESRMQELWYRRDQTDAQHEMREIETFKTFGLGMYWNPTLETKAVYLSIRNPIAVDQSLKDEDAERLADAATFTGITMTEPHVPGLKKTHKRQDEPRDIRTFLQAAAVSGYTVEAALGHVLGKEGWPALLQAAGFDGITHIGGDRMGGGHHHRVWIAFEPNQIKAVANAGTFDPAEASIYKGLRSPLLMVFRKSRPTQKVNVKTRALRQKTGKVVVQPAHTETRKKAAPKADAVKVRNTAGLTQRQMDRIHRMLEAGQAEITKPGAKYLVRVRPEGQTRYSRLGEFASMSDALKALAERMAVKTTGKSEKTYKDVGEKIGGARKDIANARDRFANNPTEANLKKLESEDPDAARRTCNRATIWPAPTVESMRAAGRSNVFIMGAMTVYSCIPAKFDSLSASDRLNYFRAVTMLRDFVEGATSSKELRERLEGISQELRATSKWVHYEKWKAAGAQFIKEPPPPPTEYQVALATALVHTPVLLKWLDGKAKRDLTFYSWKHTYVSAEDGQDFHAYGTIDGKHRQLTPEEAAARAEEWAGKVVDGKFVPKQRTKSAEEVTETQQRWERTVPTGYERKGGKAIHIRRPDDYLKRFGLRGVEFGNWMDHDASRIHVDRCAEAFQDMADLLGISATDLSLNGRLALAFGARGTGKAAAHYEPGKVVINLTKMGGAGTLGHEWAHFFDHIVGQFETGTNGQYLSHSRGATPVLDACGKVMKLIYHGTGRVELKPTDAEVPEKHGTYDYYLKSAGNNAQAAVDLIDKRYRFTDEARQQMVNYICKKTKAKSVTVSSSDSQFYSASIIQQGGKAKGYWTRPHEMFARAFETYLLDLMKEKRRENNYLVYVGKDSDAELRPYPRGEERKLLKAAFDELFAAVRAGDTLQKALSALQKATDTTSVRGSTQRTRTGVRVQPAYRAQRSKAVAKVTTPKGNVQYQYDEETLAAAKAEKFRRVAHLAKQLPRIVEAVKSDLAQGDTPQSKVVAAIVALIDRCCFRIGTDEYAEKHGTYGVTTLSPEHVTVDGATIRFQFTGKKQVPWDTATTDPDLADFIAHLASDAPGDRLFWYHRDGRQYPIRANHVNDWLRDYGVSAKDFRTYHATRLCFEELKRLSSRQPLAKKEIKQRVKQAVAATAERLGHTPAVCRQSYILPAVIDDFEANGGRLSIDPWKTARNMGKSFLLAFGGNAQ